MPPINAERVLPLNKRLTAYKVGISEAGLEFTRYNEEFLRLRGWEYAFQKRATRVLVGGKHLLSDFFGYPRLDARDNTVDVVMIEVRQAGQVMNLYYQPILWLSKKKEICPVMAAADGSIYEVFRASVTDGFKWIDNYSLPDKQGNQYPLLKGIETEAQLEDKSKLGENRLNDGRIIRVDFLTYNSFDEIKTEATIRQINAGLQQTLALASRLVTGEDIEY